MNILKHTLSDNSRKINQHIFNRKLIILLVIGVFCVPKLFAYNYIYVQDPQNFEGDQGTIDNAQFTLHPRGAYMEVGMYLSLSAGESYLSEQRNMLEVVMGFDLPKGSMIIDSWLWINDDIIRADIRDRWTASTIYEDIVGRQQDPSILFKNYDDQYELRVFPMQADSSRRVKISYLVPVNWNQNSISMALPTNLLNQSAVTLNEIDVQVFPNEQFFSPEIISQNSPRFRPATHATLGMHEMAILTNKQYVDGLTISLSSSVENGVFLQHYEGLEENYYQLVIQPAEVFAIKDESPKRIAVLIDYDINNTSISKDMMIQSLEDHLLEQLTDQDFFNIFISQADISPIHEKWIPATEASIKNYLSLINVRDISNFSNLPDLLTKGIDYIKSEESEGSIFLLSSASQVGHPDVANGFIQELTDLIGEDLIPIYISDYQNKNAEYFWLNNTEYIGNDYFYSNIAKLTKGSVQSIREHQTIANVILNSFYDITAIEGILDIHTTLENGFCYGRFNLNENRNKQAINRPFIQVGKYQGSFPFEIQASGISGKEVFSKTITVDPAEQIAEAKTLQTMWAGNYIQSLESNTNSNLEVREIIDWSLDNRILSLYTAFLALEVEQGGIVCQDCVDETDLDQTILVGSILPDSEKNEPLPGNFDFNSDDGTLDSGNTAEEVVATKDILLDSQVSITASPNPFSDQTTIHIKVNHDISIQDVIIQVYDLNGRLIKTLTDLKKESDENYEIIWDGLSEQGLVITNGMYIVRLQTPIGQKNFKLMYLR